MSLKAIKPLSEEKAVSAVAEKPVSSETQSTEVVAPLTAEQLLQVIVSLQQQVAESQRQAAESQKALTEALIESTKPKERVKTQQELAAEANEKMFEARSRETERRQRATRDMEQSLCDHIAGGSPLSEQRDIAGRTSILWHRNDVNVDIGICTVCQKIFRPDQPDYLNWRKKPSFNRLSTSGYRILQDPIKAREESYLHDS